MKRIIIAASVVALATGAAIAGHHEGGDWDAKVAEKFAAIDADGSGSVTEAEFLAYVTAKAKTEFAESAGDDGELSLEEAKVAHRAKMKEKMAKMKEHHKAMEEGANEE